MINFFPQKNIPSDIAKCSFTDFVTQPWEHFRESESFFFKIQLTRIVFWGEIYRELPYRWNRYIIISGSRSKVEKNDENTVFSIFDCDLEIMLKLLQHRGNLQCISP